MTYLQMWKAFAKVCPLRGVADWRPFGADTICVWLQGNRKNKCMRIVMVDAETFIVEPCTTEDWLAFERRGINLIPTIADQIDIPKKGA